MFVQPLNSLKTYYDSVITALATAFAATLFNKSNVASGTTPVILNKTSGIVTFTDSIAGTTKATLVVTNSLITTSSVITYSLSYDTANDGYPVIASYFPYNGSVAFQLYNLDALSTRSNIVINYQIVA